MEENKKQLISTNEDGISSNSEKVESIKKQLDEALAAEDYAKVAELGEKMKSLKSQNKDKDQEETNKGIEISNEDKKEKHKELVRKNKEDSERKAEEILKNLKGEINIEKSTDSKELSETEKAFNNLVAENEEIRDNLFVKGRKINLLEIDSQTMPTEAKEEILKLCRSGEILNEKFSSAKLQTLLEKGVISPKDIIEGMPKLYSESGQFLNIISKFSPDLIKTLGKEDKQFANFGVKLGENAVKQLDTVNISDIQRSGTPVGVFEKLEMLKKLSTLAEQSNLGESAKFIENVNAFRKEFGPEIMKYLKNDSVDGKQENRMYDISKFISHGSLLQSIVENGSLSKEKIKLYFIDKIPTIKKQAPHLLKGIENDLAKLVAQKILTKEESLVMME